ncbi:MAG: sulfate ABC transporter permease subunit CysT [Lachnospiraceae bacterium]|nr:sulfate ABC transporter permease subunit CysT [Lachnospiraceae bacterium]MCR4732684.1 sulfate ABC transporter permease subunit CysT [Lachnospiraceae bacterium]
MRSIASKKIKIKERRSDRVIPGFGLSLGITVLMLSVLILIPLVSVLLYSLKLSPAQFARLLTNENVLFAFATSITCSLIAALINCFFGIILAWVLVRYDFPGKRILDGVIELPFCLPTAVAGITLSKLYSDSGWVGGLFSRVGVKISYTHIGLVLALIFIGIPFVVRAIVPVLENLDPQLEEAAYALGASSRITFFKIILSELRPAILTGFALAFARGVGEYGSVIYISGNSAKDHTQVISYVIMQKLNYMDYASATAIALVLLLISFGILFFINVIQIRQSRRTNFR